MIVSNTPGALAVLGIKEESPVMLKPLINRCFLSGKYTATHSNARTYAEQPMRTGRRAEALVCLVKSAEIGEQPLGLP